MFWFSEISEEQQHEIEQFLANKQNQRYGRRGGRGQRGRFPGRGGQMHPGQQFRPQMAGGLLGPPSQQMQPPPHQMQPPPLMQPPAGEAPPLKTRKIHVNPHFKGPTSQVVTSASWSTQASTAVSWTSQQNITVAQPVQPQPSSLSQPPSQVRC